MRSQHARKDWHKSKNLAEARVEMKMRGRKYVSRGAVSPVHNPGGLVSSQCAWLRREKLDAREKKLDLQEKALNALQAKLQAEADRVGFTAATPRVVDNSGTMA